MEMSILLVLCVLILSASSRFLAHKEMLLGSSKVVEFVLPGLPLPDRFLSFLMMAE